MNILIGDINPANILVVDENTVYFVDCDSYQVEGFPCPAGTPAFTAPELSDRCPGNRYENVLRTMAEELFAIAVLLFQIFIPGKHPYGYIGCEDPAQNIKEGHFSYALGERGADRVPEGYYKYAWSHLSRAMKEAFNQCFHEDGRGKSEFAIDKEKNIVLKLHNGRIGIADWRKIIQDYGRNLKRYGYLDKPVVDGFDLAIAPQNRRRITVNGEIAPSPFRTDGKTDAQAAKERLQGEMIRARALFLANLGIESPIASGDYNAKRSVAQGATLPPHHKKTSQSSHKPRSPATTHPTPVQNQPSPPPPPSPPQSLWKKLWKKITG